MQQNEVQVTIHLVPAPPEWGELFEVDELKEVVFVCEGILLAFGQQQTYDGVLIRQHFELLQSVMALTQHIEIVTKDVLDWEQLLRKLKLMLPQFVWVRGGLSTKEMQHVYYFDFIPLAYRETGFPFEIQLPRSIQQQLFFPEDEAVESLISKIIQLILEEHFLLTEEKNLLKPDKQPSLPENKVFGTSEDHRQLFEQLQLDNEKLAMQLESLQYTLMSEGLSHFEVELEEVADFENWNKRLRVSLRDYQQMMKKAKSLERMWRLNDELVTKTEKMTVTDTQCVYEREQVKQIKETISFGDIFLVLDECEAIEKRIKINYHPWFRKPYVQMITMDYNSLANKAAYFDILQAESYLLEQVVKQNSRKEINPFNEQVILEKEKSDVSETRNNKSRS